MNNPKRTDIERSLVEMSDEEAIDIMEGRPLDSENPDVHLSARHLARELLTEEVDDPSDAIGGESADRVPATSDSTNVIVLLGRQPWMRMAAALLLGVAVTMIVNTGNMNVGGDQEQPISMTTANVVYLEVTRGAGEGALPSISIGEEAWVSFLLYPEFSDADILRIFVERSSGDRQQSDAWATVLEEVTGVGQRDSLAVGVPSTLLEPGIYRFRVESERGDQTLSSMILPFRVEQ